MTARATFAFDVAPFLLSGVVYGTLINHRSAVAEVAAAASQPPYLAPPRAPVLYVKPRNTLRVDGDPVEIPVGIEELEVGASLGMVIGRSACRVGLAEALAHVAGFVIVNDISVPHASFYRPSIRLRARDGFCPLSRVAPRESLRDPDAVVMRTRIDGELRQTMSTADVVRGTAQLLVDVTDFMTLSPGDVLMLGVARPSPRVRAGQTSDIEVDGLGTLSNTFVAAAI